MTDNRKQMCCKEQNKKELTSIQKMAMEIEAYNKKREELIAQGMTDEIEIAEAISPKDFLIK